MRIIGAFSMLCPFGGYTDVEIKVPAAEDLLIIIIIGNLWRPIS